MSEIKIGNSEEKSLQEKPLCFRAFVARNTCQENLSYDCVLPRKHKCTKDCTKKKLAHEKQLKIFQEDDPDYEILLCLGASMAILTFN